MHRRYDQILNRLRKSGHCTVEELARGLSVSDMTIRRDLSALESSGRVLRTHGGAAISERVAFEFGFLQRSKENRAAKNAIASAAFREMRGAKTVLLDSGTTTLALAPHFLGVDGLTVLTTSLPLASALQSSPGIDLILLGGRLRRESPDLSGPLTESNLEGLHAEVAFLGADAVDVKGTAYNESPGVARLLQKMAAAADRVYCLADCSKIGKKALARIGNTSRYSGLITSPAPAPPIRQSLKKAGVHLIVATSSRMESHSATAS